MRDHTSFAFQYPSPLSVVAHFVKIWESKNILKVFDNVLLGFVYLLIDFLLQSSTWNRILQTNKASLTLHQTQIDRRP